LKIANYRHGRRFFPNISYTKSRGKKAIFQKKEQRKRFPLVREREKRKRSLGDAMSPSKQLFREQRRDEREKENDVGSQSEEEERKKDCAL